MDGTNEELLDQLAEATDTEELLLVEQKFAVLDRYQ